MLYSLNNIGFLEITDQRACSLHGIHYLEFAVTSKCNFSCPYCNTLHEQDLSTQQVFDLFDYLATEDLQFVQFTGGEPLCRTDLERLVCYARNLGIRCGISTNGSFPLKRYLDLIAVGVELYSISFDGFGQERAGTVARNIEKLAQYVHVNVGTVIDSRNYAKIEGVIDSIVALGVSDVKLSIDTHTNLPPPRINHLYGKPILDYRIQRFNRGEHMRGGVEGITRCSLIGNDISVLGNYHYPCLVYAREKGAPIGEVFHGTAVNARIKAERLQYMHAHVPEEDALCRQFCMDFKCDFNRKCLERGVA